MVGVFPWTEKTIVDGEAGIPSVAAEKESHPSPYPLSFYAGMEKLMSEGILGTYQFVEQSPLLTSMIVVNGSLSSVTVSGLIPGILFSQPVATPASTVAATVPATPAIHAVANRRGLASCGLLTEVLGCLFLLVAIG